MANPGLEKKEKAALVFIVIMGLTALLLGGFQFKNNLRAPFEPKNSANIKPIVSQQEKSWEEYIAQQSRDTDEDGLNDYEEETIYHTSPYLPDTDGDKISDAVEIAQGTDPNCPQGENCFLDDNVAAASGEVPGIIAPNVSQGDPLILGAIPSTPTVEEIKQMLLDAGFSADILKDVPDDLLEETYQEVLKNQALNKSGNISEDIEAVVGQTNLTALIKDLSDQELRELFVQSGLAGAQDMTGEELRSIISDLEALEAGEISQEEFELNFIDFSEIQFGF